MSEEETTYPEMQTGQLWNIEGELYELVDFRVTQAVSPEDFITCVFFRSKDPNSKNPWFEERVTTVLSEPHIYKLHLITYTNDELAKIYNDLRNDELSKISRKGKVITNKMGLEEWLQTVPKPPGRLYNILRRLCLKEFNDERKDISPLDITKEEFLSLKEAGKKSWEDFEMLRNINKN